MTLQEPKVEFVPIDQNVFTEQNSTTCPDYLSQETAGGGQRCIASQVDAYDCADWDDAIPWIEDD